MRYNSQGIFTRVCLCFFWFTSYTNRR